jgi:small subunit ribosomal protein S27e
MTILDVDIFHPSVIKEKQTNKKRLLIPNPRSEFVSLRAPSAWT